MAQAPETDSPKRKRKGASVMVWLLLAMVVTGLGGFGITNYGGGVSAIGTVGGRDITVTQYARALQAEISAFGAQLGTQIPLQDALNIGLDQQARQKLITTTALDAEADRVGLSVGDARVAAEITANTAFRGASGAFDRETYRFTLRNNNLTEAEFEAALRDDVARALLQGAVTGGFTGQGTLTDALYTHIAERRGLTLLVLGEADLAQPLPAPDDAALQAYYEAHVGEFTRPEAKRIRYAALLPEAVAKTLPVDDAALRKLYDEHRAEFVKPERRLVERLVFGTEAEAAAAKARIDAGETFETIVQERGLALLDIDMGDVSREDLGSAADAVFGLAAPGVVGPLPSDFGPALFRMNGVLAAEETSFDAARANLAQEYQMDAARRAIADKVEAVDDLLAGGATLEDLAQEQGMELGSIDFSAQSDAGIAAFPAFRTAAQAVQEGDFPEAVQLDDGGLVAMQLVEIVPPAPIPFAEARDRVEDGWRADALAKALAARAAEIKTAVEAGGNFGSYGILSVTPEIARDGFLEGVPQTLLPAVFKMAEGSLQVIEAPGFVGLVRLDRVIPAATEGADAAALQGAIAAQVEQSYGQDVLALFANALAIGSGVTFNQSAIDAVHAQFR